MSVTLRIFVGGQPSHELQLAVLRHSINRTCSMDVEVTPLHRARGIHHRLPKSPSNWPGTSFSFQRFLVPEECDYDGCALYLDSDMIVFSDISSLFGDFPKDADVSVMASFAQTGHTSVMLLNCGRLRWNINAIIDALDAGAYTYQQLMRELPIAPTKAFFDDSWNCLDSYFASTRLLHYTTLPTQPWLNVGHPFASLWFDVLFSAMDHQEVTIDQLRAAVDSRWIRPSMLYQAEHRVADPKRIPDSIIAADREFLSFCKQNHWNNLDGHYRNDGYK